MNQTVSIVMPTKGRVELVRQAVESVLAQTYGEFELVVLDDSLINYLSRLLFQAFV